MKDVVRLSFVILFALFAAACARNEAAQAPAAPPSVQVAKVLSKPVTEFDEFTGRFEAVERVEVRPRVSGYVTSTHFEQGHEVKKGDVLYVIDPRPYQAALKRAQQQFPLEDEAQLRSRLPSCGHRQVIGPVCQDGMSRVQRMLGL